ncbi:Reverse transcriptase, RNA-dependent DNA polymerase [Corchorus capsularis]|uniref:Reverse transcriptase, RNA-dependent DNA polymerase n=1 Tax=Corchorus capsularis TaxID=210143 RepID=A0A1R3JU71_COCAP|nr:Reverse transcriptase, RNA-dependent DNA polymerase [Corchorus capsularis]
MNSSNSTTLDSSNPYFLHHSDNPVTPLVSTISTGDNYSSWNQPMMTALSAKNKFAFVNSTLQQPKSSSSLSPLWARCNDMVKSWLLNSVSKEIASSIIFETSAATMWTDLKESVNRVYSLLLQEEKQRQVSAAPDMNSDKVAFAIAHSSSNRTQNFHSGSSKFLSKNRPTCEHCKMVGHTKNKCYILYGYPHGHRLHRGTKSKIDQGGQISKENTSSMASLTSEQIQQLLSLLPNNQSSKANFVGKVSLSPNFPVWIVDTGYRLYDLSNQEYLVSRDVVFQENIFPFQQPRTPPTPSQVLPLPIPDNHSFNSLPSTPIESLNETPIISNDSSLNEISLSSNEDQPLARPQRNRRPPPYLQYYECSKVRRQPSQSSSTTSGSDPNWKAAIDAELHALEANKTWSIVDLPPHKSPVGCKWVFKVKYKSDGSIERYKARLVAKGYTQQEGIDFHETFAPVAKMTTVRCLLAIASAKNWPLYQLDVQNAFLHGDLDEEVYMSLPPGATSKGENSVCKLHKSLHGLKQASRQWFAKFSTALLTYGFVQSRSDYSLFIKSSKTDFFAILVYVDDIVITGNNSKLIDSVKNALQRQFSIKDLGSLKYFLGLEVAHSKQGIYLSQRKYTLELLSETGLAGARPLYVPMEQNIKLYAHEGELVKDPSPYRRLIGKLIYLSITIPDIMYFVHVLSQFMNQPRHPHFDAALRLVRYLKSSPGQGILLSSLSDFKLRAFSDSDWASCPDTRRSLTGFCILLGSSPISWKTKKQQTVSCSSAESEYRAMVFTCREIVLLQSLLHDFGISQCTPASLHCDNKAALHIAANPVFS